MESSIKSESNLEIILKNFYTNKNQEFKIFKIHANSVEDIIYLRTFIKSFEESYKFNFDYNNECDDKKYIFTIHILRKELKNENKNKPENKNEIESKTEKEIKLKLKEKMSHKIKNIKINLIQLVSLRKMFIIYLFII